MNDIHVEEGIGSTAERRGIAVSEILKKGKLTRETLTLIPREQFASISEYYGLDLDFPREMRKFEVENLIWQALLESELVKENVEGDDQTREAVQEKHMTNLATNDTGARPKVSEMSITFSGNVTTFASSSTSYSAAPPVFVSSGINHGGFSVRPPSPPREVDRSTGWFSGSSAFTSTAPRFATAGFSQPFFGTSPWGMFSGTPSDLNPNATDQEEEYENSKFTQKVEGRPKPGIDTMMLGILQSQIQQHQQQSMWMQNQQEVTMRVLQQLSSSLPRNRDDSDDLHYLRNVNYLPKYVEGEDIEAYLEQFQQACEDVFPRHVWARLLSRQLKGNVRECVQALPDEHRNDFDRVKQAILLKFQRVPESYRRDFRNTIRGDLSHAEFLTLLRKRIKGWIRSEHVDSFEDLKELMVKEAFFSKISPETREYLVDKQGSLQDLALLADKFSCLKGIGKKSPSQGAKNTNSAAANSNKQNDTQKGSETDQVSPGNFKKGSSYPPSMCSKCGIRHKSEICPPFTADLDCYRCHSKGHISRVCKEKDKQAPSTAAVVEKDRPTVVSNSSGKQSVNKRTTTFSKYCHKGKVKVGGKYTQLTALRDTGAEQTIISRRCLPENKVLNNTILLRGISGEPFPCPIVKALVHIPALDLKTRWKVAVVDSLAFEGVDMIVGNDIIDSVQSTYPVIGKLSAVDPCENIEGSEMIFPACVTTRAQAKANKVGTDTNRPTDYSNGKIQKGLPFQTLEKISTATLIREQNLDSSLKECFDLCTRGDKKMGGQSFHLQNGVLIRKWSSKDCETSETETQIVVPTSLRKRVMTLAHDIPLAGHMGTRATINRASRNFFGPICEGILFLG